MALLNQPQAEAVLHENGPLLVYAGAGSGKTRVITFRIARLIAECGIPPYRILAVTFTNKAAREMRERLDELIGSRLAADLWVGTFHSVCAKLLRRYGEEVGVGKNFVIYDDADQKALMTRIMRDLHLDDGNLQPRAVLAKIHKQKQEGRGLAEAQAHLDRTHHLLYQSYEQRLKESQALDFEDLIFKLTLLAEDPTSPGGKELRERFEHVLVDEFQDTNGIQYRLVRALSASTRNLCVVGDDDQSIYSWRGADVTNIRGFQKDFAGAQVIKLEQNYRSSGNIVASALAIIAESKGRSPKELWTDADEGVPVRIVGLGDERDEAAVVCQRVQALIAEGVDPPQIAVFYRTNAQSRVIEESLRGANIAHQIVGGLRFYDRAEVKDALSYLRLVLNPRSEADFLRIVNVPARGIGGKTVETLVASARHRGDSFFDSIVPLSESPSLGTGPSKKLLSFWQLVQGWRKQAEILLPTELLATILSESGYIDKLQKDDSVESDARLENLKELQGAIAEYEKEAGLGGDTPTLAGFLERISLNSALDVADSAAKAEVKPQILLMTVHSSKGLEFDYVFITGMEENTFPYQRQGEVIRSSEYEEERRLAYVAVTRARKQLQISHVQKRTLFGMPRYLSPSSFLDALPSNIIERENLQSEREQRWGDEYSSGSYGRGSGGYGGGGYGGGGYGGGSYGGYQRPARAVPNTPMELSSQRSPKSENHLDRGGSIVEYDEPSYESNSQSDVEMRQGMKVFHQRFGTGRVEKWDTNPEPVIWANFPGFGSKKILARFLSFPDS